VQRGGHYSTASLQNVRSGGARLNNKRLNAVIDYIGFRFVNGVGRGRSRWSRAYPNTVRSGYRYGDTRTLVYSVLGFRCEWCKDG